MLTPATTSAAMPPIPNSQQPPYPLFDKVVTLPEAAHLAGVSVDTLRRCHKRGEIKILKLSPRRIGVRLTDLKTFLDNRAA